MEGVIFEKFSVYGFSLDYPTVCRIEFNPKSRREAGDVAFHFPDKEKIFLTWGELEKVRKRFRTVEDQAENNIERVKKSQGVKKFERVEKDLLNINSHKAAYNHIRLDEAQRSFLMSGKPISHEAYSMHLHCDESSRYFVIYALLSSRAPEDFAELIKRMVDSFNCH